MHQHKLIPTFLFIFLIVGCQNTPPLKKDKASKENPEKSLPKKDQSVDSLGVNTEGSVQLIKGSDSILISKKKVVYDYDKAWSVINYEFYDENQALSKWQSAVNHLIRKSLYRPFDSKELNEPLSKELIVKVLKSLKAEAKRYEDDFGHDMVWNRMDTISIEDKYESFVSVTYFCSEYTGGAHGMYSVGNYYFDKVSGKELHLKDFFDTKATMLKAAENTFRKTVGISQSKPFDQTDYFFSKFYLPDNFKITAKGITFSYNPYEVSNWANGIVEFTMTKAQLAPYLKRKID